MKSFLKTYLLYFPWTIALVASLGSLYFSEMAQFPPCVLCWYQRICMYPLVVILAVGILRKDKTVTFYALPLAVAGLAIAFYHNLLYYNLISESLAPCIMGISCTTKFIEWFGFVTIPLLSLMAFVSILCGLLLHWRISKK